VLVAWDYYFACRFSFSIYSHFKGGVLMRNKVKLLGVSAVMFILLVGASPALAVGVADASVTTAFTGLEADAAATLGSVAIVAVAIMGVFLAWKYGRKIFSQVAK
jgi:hypothetical protein